MGMYRLSEPRLRSVALYDLLDPPRSKRSTAACFEQVSVFGICLQVTLQYQPKTGWKKDIAVDLYLNRRLRSQVIHDLNTVIYALES
jgi:hypothetical protein